MLGLGFGPQGWILILRLEFDKFGKIWQILAKFGRIPQNLVSSAEIGEFGKCSEAKDRKNQKSKMGTDGRPKEGCRVA